LSLAKNEIQYRYVVYIEEEKNDVNGPLRFFLSPNSLNHNFMHGMGKC